MNSAPTPTPQPPTSPSPQIWPLIPSGLPDPRPPPLSEEQKAMHRAIAAMNKPKDNRMGDP